MRRPAVPDRWVPGVPGDFRVVPPEAWQGSADAWQLRVRQHLLERAACWLSVPFWWDRRWLRAVILNPFSDEQTLSRVVRSIEDLYA